MSLICNYYEWCDWQFPHWSETLPILGTVYYLDKIQQYHDSYFLSTANLSFNFRSKGCFCSSKDCSCSSQNLWKIAKTSLHEATDNSISKSSCDKPRYLAVLTHQRTPRFYWVLIEPLTEPGAGGGTHIWKWRGCADNSPKEGIFQWQTK